MHKLIGLLAVISVGGVSPAFATDPPATTTTSMSSTAAPSPSSAKDTTGITAQTSNGKVVKLVAGDQAAAIRLGHLKAAGYRAEMHGDTLVFCRREAQLGSRFETKVCRTADSIEEHATAAKELTERTQRVGNDTPGH